MYDITDWIDGHPGGSVIMRAAGGALEPYWSVFAFHQRRDIVDMLQEFKIGEVRTNTTDQGNHPGVLTYLLSGRSARSCRWQSAGGCDRRPLR